VMISLIWQTPLGCITKATGMAMMRLSQLLIQGNLLKIIAMVVPLVGLQVLCAISQRMCNMKRLRLPVLTRLSFLMRPLSLTLTMSTSPDSLAQSVPSLVQIFGIVVELIISTLLFFIFSPPCRVSLASSPSVSTAMSSTNQRNFFIAIKSQQFYIPAFGNKLIFLNKLQCFVLVSRSVMP
jgi:hypothetical protein